MSEITKLYEKAGIKLKYSGWLDMGDLDTQMTYIQCDTKEEWDECVFMSRSSYSSDDENYDKPKMEYPPFTTEKQLGLIKYFSNNYNISINKDNNIFKLLFINKDGIHNFYTSGVDFAKQLALFVISRYENQILTPEEKQQIKEILK